MRRELSTCNGESERGEGGRKEMIKGRTFLLLQHPAFSEGAVTRTLGGGVDWGLALGGVRVR